jgi:Tol biopolymer transport system component
MNTDGSNLTAIDRERGDSGGVSSKYPEWSPDSKQIAFNSYRDDGRQGGIYIMNADGSDVKNLVNNPPRLSYANHPAWSPP